LVPAAIDFMDAACWAEVRARCHALAVETMHRACAITGEAPIGADDDFAQMAPIPLPGSAPERLGSLLLERHRIEIPVTEHGGRRFLRASFNGYNTAADAEALLEALRELLRGA
jgi:isopenicillin-N epimerase